MQHRAKQTPQNNNSILIISMIAAAIAIAFAIGEHRRANMVQYAANNNCSWHYNGTAYGDNRDYTCK